jgi:hypothetical protein
MKIGVAMTDTLDSFICERMLSVKGGREVTVRVGAPITSQGGAPAAGENCYCLYQIVGIGDEKVRKAWGVDSFQAIHMALIRIGSDLYASNEARAGNLIWSAGNVPGDLGFPVFERLADLVPQGASTT